MKKLDVKASGFLNVINFLMLNGILSWAIVLLVNALLFCITLFYSKDVLEYMLGFFGISIIGQLIYMVKRK